MWIDPVPCSLMFITAGRFRQRTNVLACEILQVSITGALLGGPPCEKLTLGTAVHLQAGENLEATAVLRRTLTHEARAEYGVEIVAATRAFRDRVSAHIAANRGDLELAWRLAR